MFNTLSPGFLKEVFVAILSGTTYLEMGISETYAALLLPQLQSSDSPIPDVTADETSWMSSINFLLGPVGSIIGGVLSDVIGRKLSLVLAFVPYVIAWSIIIFASTIEMFYIAMVFTGIGSGMNEVSTTYVAEICTANRRGPLMSLFGPLLNFGFLFGNIINYWLGWRSAAICFLMMSMIGLVAFFSALPESPTWLVSKGRTDKAFVVLRWLRDTDTEVKVEITDLENHAVIIEEKGFRKRDLSKMLQLIQYSWKPFCIFMIMNLLVHGTGSNYLISQIPSLYQQMKSPVDVSRAAVIFSLFCFLGSLVSPYLFTKIGRKPLHGLSAFGMVIPMLVIAAYQTSVNSWNSRPYWWIVQAAVCVWAFSLTLGVYVVPYVVVGEIFRQDVRGFMTGFSFGAGYLAAALFVKIFTFILFQLGAVVTLWIFAVFCALNVPAAKYILPETKDKTLIQIQDEYFPKKKLET